MDQYWIGLISLLLKQFLVLATMKKCRTGLQIIQEIIGGLGRVAGLNHSSCCITFHLVSFKKYALKIGFYLGGKYFCQPQTHQHLQHFSQVEGWSGCLTQADCVNSLISELLSAPPSAPGTLQCLWPETACVWSVLRGDWGRGEVCKAKVEGKFRDLHLCHAIVQELMA